jgi:hypothetical protein
MDRSAFPNSTPSPTLPLMKGEKVSPFIRMKVRMGLRFLGRKKYQVINVIPREARNLKS